MRKRPIYVGLLLFAAAIAAIVVFFRPEREPEYGGKKLSEWVKTYDNDWKIWEFDRKERHEADEPILRIGTNGLPYLVKWMGYEESRWKSKLFGVLKPVVPSLVNSWEGSEWKKQRRAVSCVCAVMVLGPKAKGAIRDLAKIASGPDSRRTQLAICCLPALGEVALPSLLAYFTNAPPRVRTIAINRIGFMERGTRPAIEALESFLGDPDSNVRLAAIAALRKIDPMAGHKDFEERMRSAH